MDQERLQSLLADLRLPEVRWHNSTASTNDEALQWIAEGAAEGCLVAADAQDRGRGRLGRRWITEPGSALAFSLILKPREPDIAKLALFSPLGALAVSQALEQGWALEPQIKWPNDVLLGGRKVCGILVEAYWQGSELRGVVIGIGVNIAPASVPPDEAVLYPATSVEQALGKPIERFEALHGILERLLFWREKVSSEEFFSEWEKRLALKNRWVTLQTDAQNTQDELKVEGVLTGIDPAGNLVLRLANGEMRTISVGDVHLRPV